MSSKHIKRFIRTESLPDNIREHIFGENLLVFPESILVHPEAISSCIFDRDDAKEGIELLEKCPHFEYESDYIDNSDMMLICAHCYSNGACSYCEVYTVPALLMNAGIFIPSSKVIYG